MLDLKTAEPFGMSYHVFGAFFGEREVISGMGSASRRFVIALDEAFERVLADCRKHEETSLSVGLLYLLRQALVHHRSHAIEYVKAQIALCIANRFRAFQSAASGKHGKPAEESLFRGIEQAVTPFHGAAQCLLPGREIAGAAGQQAQRLSSRASMAEGESSLMRAAASSMARGRPSRRAQMAATTGAFSL